MRLAIELYGVRIGTLDGDARAFDFTPAAEAIETFGSNSPVLSTAIPLTAQQRRDRAGRRRNWFAELLPEGDQYEYLLAQGGLRRGDTPAFLARYGRDIAGALQIWDLDDPTEPKTPALRPVSDAEIRGLMQDPRGVPLANDRLQGKSSLGGVQPKIVLTKTNEGWAQALGGSPSTHILKPRLSGDRASVIYDEEYGARLARRMRLAAFETGVQVFDGLPALVVERYDRVHAERVHQEDLSQALGASGNEKYQELGGVVSLGRVAQTLQRHAAEQDLHRLARMVLLAVAVGNLDMHTKNFALLHPRSGEVRLAPAYDMVPQTHLSGDGRLALSVHGKYRHAEITRADLVEEFHSWGVRRGQRLIDDGLEELESIVASESPVAGAFSELQQQIAEYVGNLRNGSAVGSPRYTVSHG